MNKSKFEERITTSFKTETPDILDKIKSSEQFFVPDKVKKYDFSRFFNKRLSYSLASIFVLALVVFSILTSGSEVPAVVASTVTLDINPSVQITLDEDDNVINITAINTDGELLIDRDIQFKGLSLDRAIELIIDEAIKRGYIIDGTEGNIILISVDSSNETIRARVDAALEARIKEVMANRARIVEIIRENRDDLTAEEIRELVAIAERNKLTAARLLLINRIIKLDDSYTVENLKDLSVRNLYRILNEELDETEDNPGNSGNPGNN